MSEVISIRVNDTERETLAATAALYGCSISTLMKRFTFDRLEDEYDLKAADDYIKDKGSGKMKLYDHDEVWEELDGK